MIEETLNRIANALEKQTEALNKLVAFQAEALCGANEPAVSTGPEVARSQSRQEIKERLDQMGIAYNDRLRTENLEKMLQDAIDAQKQPATAPVPVVTGPELFTPEKPAEAVLSVKKPAPKAAPAAPDFFEEAATPAKKKYTVQEAIDIAKRLAAKFGADKSVAIIQSFGCGKISEIEAKGKLQDFVGKVLAKEAEYEKK